MALDNIDHMGMARIGMQPPDKGKLMKNTQWNLID